jgi:hypothetical protein
MTYCSIYVHGYQFGMRASLRDMRLHVLVAEGERGGEEVEGLLVLGTSEALQTQLQVLVTPDSLLDLPNPADKNTWTCCSCSRGCEGLEGY